MCLLLTSSIDETAGHCTAKKSDNHEKRVVYKPREEKIKPYYSYSLFIHLFINICHIGSIIVYKQSYLVYMKVFSVEVHLLVDTFCMHMQVTHRWTPPFDTLK